jgi:hypothetical protein
VAFKKYCQVSYTVFACRYRYVVRSMVIGLWHNTDTELNNKLATVASIDAITVMRSTENSFTRCVISISHKFRDFCGPTKCYDLEVPETIDITQGTFILNNVLTLLHKIIYKLWFLYNTHLFFYIHGVRYIPYQTDIYLVKMCI